MNYPGIDNIKNTLIFRMAGNSMQHRLGAGLMKKVGIRQDQIDFKPVYYSLSYVIRGNGEYINSRGNRYQLTQGSIFQRFPGIKHSTILDPKSNWAECFIDFGPAIYQTLNDTGVVRSDMPVFAVHPMAGYEKNMYQLTVDLKNAPPEELPSLLLRSLGILGKIYSARLGRDTHEDVGFVRQACDILESAAIERANLRKLVESNGWGYEWFRKTFKHQMGISPGQYILRHRLEVASNMILTTNLSFGEIANRLGYQNQYEFSAQFKKHIGQSPIKYRKERTLHL